MAWAVRIIGAALAAMAPFAAAPAAAGPAITEKTEHYLVDGDSGVELLRDMNRRGPRHGFLTKAIAQTRYDTDTRGEMRRRDGVCRVGGGGVSIEITYIYPRPRRPLSGDLARRWRGFMADNIRHEGEHGRIARAMAVAMERTLRRFSMPDAEGCARARVRLREDVKAVVARYEARQVAFDAREHRDGGAVDRSVRLLLGVK